MVKRLGAGGIVMVALVLGAATAFLLYRWAADLKKNAKENWKPVVTALEEIKPRVKITREMLQVTAMPQELIAKDALTNIEAVEGRVALKPINAQEQIRSGDLVRGKDVPGPSYAIPPGMRAITIEAGGVNSVGEAVRPGDHVDILASYLDSRLQQESTKLILQDILVLWIDKGEMDPSGKAGASTSITLAVKPEQTELVTAASRGNALRVVLRPPNDNQIAPTPGVTVRDFSGARVVVEDTHPSQPVGPTEGTQTPVKTPVKSSPREIIIIRGTRQDDAGK
jgi:pilus assembly protein CpaB